MNVLGFIQNSCIHPIGSNIKLWILCEIFSALALFSGLWKWNLGGISYSLQHHQIARVSHAREQARLATFDAQWIPVTVCHTARSVVFTESPLNLAKVPLFVLEMEGHTDKLNISIMLIFILIKKYFYI